MNIELLAPVGHIESFFAAKENGANAVYLGLKHLSARASATNFSLSELASLIPYAHKHRMKVHVALNSLVTAGEVRATLDLLQALVDLQVDAVIVQDPGIFYLKRHCFPELRIHASTLTTIHNQAGVNQLQKMGAKRVVLARELNLDEIKQIASKTQVELEIFVHGALCYSFSGLCLASSFRGGHSGLQGRCVQPCRLRFRQGRKEGFFLSCNDLCALPLIPQLKKMRLAAFKVEGRMKPAAYIAQVVKAYRLVLDASPDKETEAVAEAQELLAQSPARRLTSGFLQKNNSEEILTPHRSGSSGLWVGTVKAVQNGKLVVNLRYDVQVGDRLRPESSEGKEKSAFTVSEIFSAEGQTLTRGQAGNIVLFSGKGNYQPRERLFRVGAKQLSTVKGWSEIKKAVDGATSFRNKFSQIETVWDEFPAPSTKPPAVDTLLVKVDRAGDLTKAFQSPAAWVLYTATRLNLEKLARKRLIPAQKKRLVWSLPPLIAEREIDYYRAAIEWYLGKGFLNWEMNNWGHFDFFRSNQKVRLIAGHRFNLRNVAALAEMFEAGCNQAVLSLEITREELQNLGREKTGVLPIVTVYAWPPVFSSRLIPKLLEGKAFSTPRKESYFYRKSSEFSFIYPESPINWMEKVSILRAYGFHYFMLDLSDGPSDQSHNFEQILSGFKRMRADRPYSVFNFDRQPVPKRKTEVKR